MAPPHTIAGMLELYKQLTPTKVYHASKTHTHQPDDTLCRFCVKTAESISHVLASCSALAQNKYLARHNAALKVYCYGRCLESFNSLAQCHRGILRSFQTQLRVTRGLSILGYSSLYSKWASEAEQSGCEIYRSREEESSNGSRNELPVDGERQKKPEKTAKYAPLRWELKQQFPEYDDHRCPRRVVQRSRRGYDGTVRGSRRRDSSPNAESHHFAHPEHYLHTESDVLRIAEKWPETFLVIFSNFIYHTLCITQVTKLLALGLPGLRRRPRLAG